MGLAVEVDGAGMRAAMDRDGGSSVFMSDFR
jgi:hypothetical protein